METKQMKKPLKPLKILVNLFAKSKKPSQECHGGSALPSRASNHFDSQLSPPIIRTHLDSISMVGACSPAQELYTEFEALHLSRQDNPFLQQHQQRLQSSFSQDNLDTFSLQQQQSSSYGFGQQPPSGFGQPFGHPFGGSQGAFSGCSRRSLAASPEPCSPTRSCDPLVLEEVHAHLIRSPPPISWPERAFPLSPRSNGTFSPDSSDDLDCSGISMNYYTRSQSEEHILSPRRDLSKTLSPTRGATPDTLMTASMFESGGVGEVGDDQWQRRRQKVRRNHTLNLSVDDGSSPCRNQTGCDYGATSVYSYSMPSGPRRSIGARSQLLQPTPPKKVSGDSFFSSWRPRRRRTSERQDAKSMENLQADSSLRLLPSSSAAFSPTGPFCPAGACSPAARKSVGSVAYSPRNCATMFTKWKVTEPVFIA